MGEYTPETLRQQAAQMGVMADYCIKRDDHGDEVDADRYRQWENEVNAHADAWEGDRKACFHEGYGAALAAKEAGDGC